MPNQVMLNDFMKYPVDWETSLLGDVVDINPETIETGTPATFHFKYIDISSVNLGNISWDTVTNQVLSSAPSRARRVARSEDVLFSTVRPGLQSHAYAEWPMQNYYICSTGFAILRAKRMYPRFLYHLIFSDEVSSQVRKLELGSNYPAINESDVSTLCIPIPSGAEQRHIAEILDTIDEVIQETEALISKLKAMKHGLLHDLLTRGLDKNGKLRDSKAHPEQFKDSPLGRIPKEWEVVSVGEIASHVGSGLTPRGGSEVYKTSGVMFIRSQNVTFEGLKLEDIAFIDSKTHEAMRRSEVFAHDVLLNITGASIGRCCPLPEGLGPTNVNQHVCAIRLPNPCREDAFYLSSVLASHIGQHQIDVLNAGGNREGLNYEQLRGFILPWPQKDERTKAADIIAANDARIRTEEQYRDKLKLQKKGLMQDLLTGKVRVKT